MINHLNNILPIKLFILPFLIFLSLILIQLPNNRVDIDQINYTDFDTKNSQEENESNYEIELDDFIDQKQNKSQLYIHNLHDNTYSINYPKIIYLDTPYPPPEIV